MNVTNPKKSYDAIVVGGGFYGCNIALKLAKSKKRVLLVEALNELLGRASYVNQARIHGGYHYPRSFLTANRSQINSHQFISFFGNCVVRSFKQYYAVAKMSSTISAHQFSDFCRAIHAPLKPAPEKIRRLFNKDLIEEVFEVEEFAFDANKLRISLQEQLAAKRVEVLLSTSVKTIKASPSDGLLVILQASAASTRGPSEVQGKEVWLCTYSSLNKVLVPSGVPVVPLHHELTELVMVKVPPSLEGVGVTVIDGPFFSFMPFPANALYTLSHVRYTPHASWDDTKEPAPDLTGDKAIRRSNFDKMRKDASRYMPSLTHMRHVESVWEVKTTLPRSSENDSRPILFQKDQGLKGLRCVLGGKIDNVFDVLAEMEG